MVATVVAVVIVNVVARVFKIFGNFLLRLGFSNFLVNFFLSMDFMKVKMDVGRLKRFATSKMLARQPKRRVNWVLKNSLIATPQFNINNYHNK